MIKCWRALSLVAEAAGRRLHNMENNPYDFTEVNTQTSETFLLLRRQIRQSDNIHTLNLISVSKKALSCMYQTNLGASKQSSPSPSEPELKQILA